MQTKCLYEMHGATIKKFFNVNLLPTLFVSASKFLLSICIFLQQSAQNVCTYQELVPVAGNSETVF